ncbi:CBS domain-containing protein CBSX3, mitochondrial-like [Populus trichocarpa]|uniref:CBS domain-containing protein CBSX3, mitochondrial-like n=1 Tax=Populus trichocarpa TaxID=3694 RepID=UPI002277C856|nr:CBS domain-containing protein CBSX3, mitochondrial-like [Populus trichocarpa]
MAKRFKQCMQPLGLLAANTTIAITNPVSHILAVDNTLNFHFSANSVEMQGLVQGVRSCQETLRVAILRHPHVRDIIERRKILSHSGCVTSSPPVGEKGLENLTVADVLVTKGEEKLGSWLWCRTTDTVYDAVKNTYLRKIIAQGRSSKYTRVGEIMTDENKLITVASDTNILQAMKLMTDNHIRHVPVIDGTIAGMVSMVDVVRAVAEQQGRELKRLNEFIKGIESNNINV